jgi:hypothetical protein
MSNPIPRAAWLIPALLAFVSALPCGATEVVPSGTEIAFSTAAPALLVSPLAEPDPRGQESQEIPEQEPEPRPQPFPAPPEQPPAERIPEGPEGLPTDQPPAEETEIEVEIPEVATELPSIEDAEPEAEADSGTAWYADPFWILIALVFVVVVLILIFSGRRRA